MYSSSNDWAPNDLTYAPGVLSEPSLAVEPVIRFLAGALRRDLKVAMTPGNFAGAKCQRTPIWIIWGIDKVVAYCSIELSGILIVTWNPGVHSYSGWFTWVWVKTTLPNIWMINDDWIQSKWPNYFWVSGLEFSATPANPPYTSLQGRSGEASSEGPEQSAGMPQNGGFMYPLAHFIAIWMMDFGDPKFWDKTHVKMSHVFKDWLLRRSAESETREDAFWWHPCSLQYGLPIVSAEADVHSNRIPKLPCNSLDVWLRRRAMARIGDRVQHLRGMDTLPQPWPKRRLPTLICLFIVSLEQLPMCIPFGWGFYPKFTVGLHRRRTILLRLETIQYHSICLWMIEIFISIFRYFLTRRFKKSEPAEWTGMLLGNECIDEKLARSRSHLSSC